GSSGNNYLKTTSDFSYVNENAFANISLNGTEWSIKFTGSNTRNLLRYNSNSKIFSCYGSGQGPISIYVSDEDPVAFDTEKWAKDFNDKLGVICDPTGETALTATKWNETKKIFDDLSIPNKMAVKYGATDGVEMSKALKAYDFIIKTKYAALNDFLERREGTRANALMLPGATDSTTWTLVGIGAVTIAASASLLFFRRKKSN
ncbi:MAG: LPXTG cell wall anchor domain-containing protein, partial [Candidatus Enteromonas sp.]